MSWIHRLLSIFITVAIISENHALSIDLGKQEEELTYRLPDNVYPEYYHLEIITNLADYSSNYTFSGRVWIRIMCKLATNKIILHAKNLDIDENNVAIMTTKFDGSEESRTNQPRSESPYRDNCQSVRLKILNQYYHEEYEFYIITLEEKLKPDDRYTLYIPYEGELTEGLAGYYRSSYKDLTTGETRWLAVTQFESTDARRALPCFDEPAFKARFQVNLGHINTRKSISNMRLAVTEPLENMENWVLDRYEVTVPMSTYLLAFVVCDFNYKVSPQSHHVHFRVWARNDALDQVDYASIVGPSVLEYFEQYFDVKYPLPKMDMIAIPDFSAGAMENWGLITFRELTLLYDPAVSTASVQPVVATVVAHELAHQWFGNLVTMKWWTDLWLNEGFATYVSGLGVNFLHPEWNFLDEDIVDNVISVFSLDSLKSSHPISAPIGHPREIDQIFDTISYKKGSFVLRMMNLFLGEHTFRNGVRNYLKKHAYGNAEQDDLWECLTEEAHKNQVLPPYMSVKRIMDSWTLQTGYPVITVERNYETGGAMIYQERFLGDRTESNFERKALNEAWCVPLSYTFEAEGNFNDTQPREWLTSKESSLFIESLPKTGWVLFNIKISGLYRVKYDAENWKQLIYTLMTSPYKIAMLNRVQLIEDSLELAKTGDIDYTIPFNIIQYLEKEREYLPWKAALRNLGFIDGMMRYYPNYGYFKGFVKHLLTSIYSRLSNEKYANTPDNLSKIKHQTLILSWACKFDVGNCKEMAVKSFDSWMSSINPDAENPIPRDSRLHVYCTAIGQGGEKEWNFLWKRYLLSNVGDEQNIILWALGCTREVWLLNRYLEWTIDESSGIRKQDSQTVFNGITRSDVGYLLAKNFFKNRLVDIYNFFGPKASRLGNYANTLARRITTETDLEEFQSIVRENEEYLRASYQAVQQGLENAKINIQWQRKFYQELSEYLESQVLRH